MRLIKRTIIIFALHNFGATCICSLHLRSISNWMSQMNKSDEMQKFGSIGEHTKSIYIHMWIREIWYVWYELSFTRSPPNAYRQGWITRAIKHAWFPTKNDSLLVNLPTSASYTKITLNFWSHSQFIVIAVLHSTRFSSIVLVDYPCIIKDITICQNPEQSLYLCRSRWRFLMATLWIQIE